MESDREAHSKLGDNLSGERRFVSHPLIKPKSLEERTYQSELAEIAVKQNTLVVLPTGLGKTGIALLVLAEFLKQPDSHCVLLAPTRVLVHQHFSFLASHLNIPQDEIGVLTGEDKLDERKEIWSKRLICATPQIMLSDIRKNSCSIERFSLIIFDEVHRAIGNHAYSAIASAYGELHQGRIMGMTASLPSEKTKVEEILEKLKIAKLEIRDEKSSEVKPYVYKTEIEWIKLSLSQPLKEIQALMKQALEERLKLLEDASLAKKNRYGSIALKDLLALRMKVDQIQSTQLRSALFSGIRLLHALNLIETQSLGAFKSFMERIYSRRRGYGMSDLLNDGRIMLAFQKANDALLAGEEHPKMSEVMRLVEKTKTGEKALVFASYRDTVDQIYSELIKHGFRAGYLIGKSGQSGQSQAKQIKALEGLRNGEYDILVATQVGEEGLDVAECNLVIFYDNVPSSIRFVQRKGRTGRRKEGRVCVLLTKGTKDEAYYWLARRRLHDSKNVVSTMRLQEEKGGPMDRYMREDLGENLPTIFVDTRENAELIKRLRNRGALVEVKQLEIGDFVVSSDIAVERKTITDFVKSIFDGRLFRQLVNMSSKYPRPILIVQGEKRELAGISESAFYGALASVISDFRVPVFLVSDETDFIELVFHIARREQIEKKRDVRIREGKKPLTVSETQRYIASGIPGVSAVLADRLLSKVSTIENLFSAEERELREVEGIGDVMAQRIKQLSTARYVSSKSSEFREPARHGPQEIWDNIATEQASDEDMDLTPPEDD